MIMDPLDTLSTQRIQLSDDPNNWAWVRWQWCQVGAKSPPWPTAFGSPVWEDRPRTKWRGAQMLHEPRRLRPNQVSPFPGLHLHGTREHWQNGIQPSELVPAEVTEACGGETWWSTLPVSVGMEFGVYAGGIQLADGGISCGGSAEQYLSGYQLGTGGILVGGEADQGSPGYQVGTGGILLGGSAAQFGTGYQLGTGGILLGGSAAQYGSGYQLGTGGILVGGEASQTAGGYQLGIGGILVGGEATQGGGGSSPVLRSGTSIAHVFTGTITITAPTGVAAGDLLTAWLWWDGAAGTLTVPSGWTVVANAVSSGVRHTLCTKTAGSSEPSSYTFSYSGDADETFGTVWAVGGASSRNNGTVNRGSSTTINAPGITSTVNGFNFVAAATFGTFGLGTPPTGYTTIVEYTPSYNLYLAYKTITPGATGDVNISSSTSTLWAGVQTAIGN